MTVTEIANLKKVIQPYMEVPPLEVTSQGVEEEWYQRDYLSPQRFYNELLNNNMDSFYGVPDSLLKDFCAYVDDHAPAGKHIIAANEGNAVALATGYHLATNKFPVVYLQNSGLGNIINPILSCAMPEVYSIPMLILIGWRGEPGKKDEPQHLIQGKATPTLLDSLNIPFKILPDFQEGAEEVLKAAKEHMQKTRGPFAVLVRKRTFHKYASNNIKDNSSKKYEHSRESALKLVVKAIDNLDKDGVTVGTTGMLSRELFEHRKESNQSHKKDFLTVGSMGHASSIALGIASTKKDKNVYCLDGDGACIMHMGAMATIASSQLNNFKHIIFNNGAHDSVGGQSTGALNKDFKFTDIALGCGYQKVFHAETTQEILEGIKKLVNHNNSNENAKPGPGLLEIKIRSHSSRQNLGRPTRTPLQNKIDFQQFLSS